MLMFIFFFFQAEDGIRDLTVTGVQTCALPISTRESLAWVLRSIGLKTTCTPARSRSRAQRILASSSNRALSSTSAVTDLPASAASARALMIGLSLDVR